MMHSQLKIVARCLMLFLLVASPCMGAETAAQDKDGQKIQEQKTEEQKTTSVYFPSPKFQFEKVVEGVELTHDFIIMNKGAKTLHVQKVKTA